MPDPFPVKMTTQANDQDSELKNSKKNFENIKQLLPTLSSVNNDKKAEKIKKNINGCINQLVGDLNKESKLTNDSKIKVIEEMLNGKILDPCLVAFDSLWDESKSKICEIFELSMHLLSESAKNESKCYQMLKNPIDTMITQIIGSQNDKNVLHFSRMLTKCLGNMQTWSLVLENPHFLQISENFTNSAVIISSKSFEIFEAILKYDSEPVNNWLLKNFTELNQICLKRLSESSADFVLMHIRSLIIGYCTQNETYKKLFLDDISNLRHVMNTLEKASQNKALNTVKVKIFLIIILQFTESSSSEVLLVMRTNQQMLRNLVVKIIQASEQANYLAKLDSL